MHPPSFPPVAPAIGEELLLFLISMSATVFCTLYDAGVFGLQGNGHGAARRTMDCAGFDCFLSFERASRTAGRSRVAGRWDLQRRHVAFGKTHTEESKAVSKETCSRKALSHMIGTLHTTSTHIGLRVTSGKPSRPPQGHLCTLTSRAQLPVHNSGAETA